METGLRYWRSESGERPCVFVADNAVARMATIFCRCAILSISGLMCTVSFVPKSHGFYLAMNRDEKLARFSALPLAIVDLTDRRAMFPREPEGGTWISANDAGVCTALINWHRIEHAPVRSITSRGQVARKLV